MKNIFSFSLGVGLWLAAGLSFVTGTEPADRPHIGRVLILENERTLTGEIEQVGEQFRVKRLVGETWVPADKVLRLCASLEEGYRFLQGRANLDDPDERLRLAEWCSQHNLREQAYTEMKAAAVLRPNDPRIKRLLGYLEQARARPAPPPAAAPAEKPAPRVDVTAESLGMFASKVQPILMNACLSCHTAGRGGSFQLSRVSGPGLSNRRSLEQNLAVVLAMVDVHQPQASRLLTKAISLHGSGMTQVPLKNRQAPAYRTLEQWVTLTLEANPHLREEAVASGPGPALPLPTPPSTAGHWGEERQPGPAAPPKTTPPPPVRVPSSDPVDPDGFNREFHPERTGKER
jgi:hypothetical protein